LFSYSVTVFQLLLKLQLLQTFKLQLQLQLTDSDFSVISPFQLRLLLTGFTLPGSNAKIRNLVPRYVGRRFEFWSTTLGCQRSIRIHRDWEPLV